MALQDGNQDKQEQKTWGEFPDDVFLSIIARLSWDEICRLSCTWKKLCEGWTLYQMFFEEYSGARFQKPIGLFHGFVQSLPSTPVLEGAENGLKLTFSVIAGDGYREPHNLVISQFKDVPIVSDNALGRLTRNSNDHLKTIISCRATGCLVLLSYSNSDNGNYEGFFGKIQESSPGLTKSSPVTSGWIVMNPANGTARQIYFPSHSVHIGKGPGLQYSKAFLNGIFHGEGSHYQILASFCCCDQNGKYMYMNKLPLDEDLGNHQHAIYNTFYLYKSITKSWTKLLGSNICVFETLHDAIIYRGVIHAVLSRKYNKLSRGVKYVEEISGRTRWMPLSIPLPRDNIFAAHLFVFQGTLMITGAALCWTKDSLELAKHEFFSGSLPHCLFRQHVWRLHEESRSWVEVSHMPNHILYDLCTRSCCLNFWQTIRFCASGGYVMAGGGCELDPVYPGSPIHPQCVVVCNIVTNHWQLAHVHSHVAVPVTSQILDLFERRFDISA